MKIGIALGGGGARGYAHIGVLQVLTEAGIDCEVVTGTSAGAIVGAAYCCDRLDVLAKKAKEIKLKDIPSLFSPSWSFQGLFSGRSAIDFLNDSLTVNTIEELPKKFGSPAVDLNTGELVEFTAGDLRSALRASISIPGIFTPVQKDGMTLVDGGLIEVTPVQLTRRLGADFVIAVDLFGSKSPSPVPLSIPKNGRGISSAVSFISKKIRAPGDSKQMNLIKVIEATFSTIQARLTFLTLQIHPADLMIQPPVCNVGVLDFHRAEPVIEVGRIAAREILPRLKEMLQRS